MTPRPKTRKLGKFFLRLAVVSMATFAIGIIWFVTGPASRTYVVDPTGIPQNAWPKLSATSVQDLLLACTFVARDKSIADPAARPHRNHTYLAKYGDRYFAMFSYWFGAEDQPGGAVRYATSTDGVNWSEPKKLADPAPEHGIIARGFIQRDGKLFALYATHTGDGVFRNNQPKLDKNLAVLESEWLGEKAGWRFNRVVIKNVVNNYAPRYFGDTLIMAVRDADRDTFLATSTDDGFTWDVSSKMPLPAKPKRGEKGLYLADEPVTVRYQNGKGQVLLRNNNTEDGRLWAANYSDGGWGNPYPLEFASDASKFFPIKLNDGQTAMIGNFDPDVRRALLHIAVSEDGRDFNRLYRLSLQGQYGQLRWRSPQYPHAIVDGNTMLLGLSYGKRAISVCKGPATAQAIAAQSEFKLAPRLATGICNKNLPAILRRLFGYAGCVEHFVWG